MRQITCSSPCLHIFYVDSGSWTNIPLGSRDLPLSVEVMMPIFAEDGIPTYIGKSVEFGQYMTDLSKSRETDSIHCWISFPALTVLSELELCRSMRESGRSEVTFVGSPLTLVLTDLIAEYDLGSLVGAWINYRHSKPVCDLEHISPFHHKDGSVHAINVEFQDVWKHLRLLLEERDRLQSGPALEGFIHRLR